MPERFFRYVVPRRAAAYSVLGWHLIGMTESPHDGQACAIMEWTRGGAPTEPEGEQVELREPTVSCPAAPADSSGAGADAASSR